MASRPATQIRNEAQELSPQRDYGMKWLIPTLACLLVVASSTSVEAHYHMLLPDKASAKTGEAVTLTFQFGHPFEHQIFDTDKPKQLFVLTPDGAKVDLSGNLEKVAVDGADGKKVTAYRASFTPEKRGDHIVVALSAPASVEGEKLPLQDFVKVIVHVQTQNGWDRSPAIADFPELLPLTRPYGLKAGMAFRAEFTEPKGMETQPLAGLLVEIERFNAVSPKDLPPDEHITRSAKTDRVGTVTVTLTEPGWWAVTAIRDTASVRQRATLWVHVDDKFLLEPAK